MGLGSYHRVLSLVQNMQTLGQLFEPLYVRFIMKYNQIRLGFIVTTIQNLSVVGSKLSLNKLLLEKQRIVFRHSIESISFLRLTFFLIL